VGFVDQGDLERRTSKDFVVQCADDDGDGVPDQDVLVEICEDVDVEVRSVLFGKGWSLDALNELESDKALRRLAATIGAELLAFKRREFFLADGSTIYSLAADRARKTLKLYATGENRSVAEDRAGVNPVLKAKRDPPPKFQFAPSSTKPRGPGGF
jgi:hypothetical protein